MMFLALNWNSLNFRSGNTDSIVTIQWQMSAVHVYARALFLMHLEWVSE